MIRPVAKDTMHLATGQKWARSPISSCKAVLRRPLKEERKQWSYLVPWFWPKRQDVSTGTIEAMLMVVTNHSLHCPGDLPVPSEEIHAWWAWSKPMPGASIGTRGISVFCYMDGSNCLPGIRISTHTIPMCCFQSCFKKFHLQWLLVRC